MSGRNIFLSLFSLFLITHSLNLFSQNDSIIMSNGNLLVGEIKELKQGVLQYKTSYSDSDFKIEWDKVKYLKSNKMFIVLLSNNERHYVHLRTDSTNQEFILINDLYGNQQSVLPIDIIYLKRIKQSFVSRFSLLLSLGYTLTKENNNSQFNGRLNTSYQSSKFNANANFSFIRNFQTIDDTINTNTRRTEGGLGANFYIFKNLYLTAQSDLLQSSEQKLRLRAITKGGVGRYLVNNHIQYLMMSAGAAWNYENFEDPEVTDKNSLEGFVGLQYNIFDMGDLGLQSSVFAYPGITENGRFRTDFNLNLKYDLPMDFFLSLGYTLNYDNQPAEGATNTDYVLQTSFGWEL